MANTSEFGSPYFLLNLKATQKDKQLTGGEEQLQPELISSLYGAGELEPYYGQEEMAGRYNRPAITSRGAGNQPALTGGGGTQKKGLMDYVSQLAVPAAEVTGKALRGTPEVPTNIFNQYGSLNPEQREFIAGAAPLGAGQEWGTFGNQTGSNYPSDFTGSIYEQPRGGFNVGQAIGGGIGALTGAISQNPAMGYMGQTVGQTVGTMLGGQALTPGAAFTGSLGAGLQGQTDFTNPYSGYVQSILNLIPGLGAVLGTPIAGIIEGIFGKGQAGLGENPQYTQARESGQARAKQLKDQGMTPYQIWQWANENGYAVNAGTQEPGTEGTGDVYTVYNPQEAMIIDQIESGMFGTQPQRPMQSDQGWYWGGEGQWSGWTPGSEWKVPEYHKSLEELLGKKSFTKAMSNIYEGDESYLTGAPDQKKYVNPWQY